MASVEVGECWLALGWYWSLVSQWAWPYFSQNWYGDWWFGSNGEAFVPSPVDPFVTEKEPFWVGWREWRGEWYRIEKLKCVLKKKIIIFIIYEIVCREKILVRRICWILLSSGCFIMVSDVMGWHEDMLHSPSSDRSDEEWNLKSNDAWWKWDESD